MKKVLAGHWAMCRSGKDGRIATGPAPLPSDEYLNEFRAEETEDLFDGKWMATYHTSRMIHPDIHRDCELTVYTARTAYIEHACSHQIGGSTTPIVTLLIGETPWDYEVDEQKRECGNDRPGPPDVSGQPSESAGSVRCIWHSKILSPEADGARSSLGDERDRKPDSCLYAQMPTYPIGDGRYPVVLKTWHFNRFLFGGPDIPELLKASLVPKEDSTAFSDGDPISPQRFTRTAMESFLNQPSKTPVNSAR